MMNKGWLFLGAVLAAGTAAVVWNVMDEITTICEDYDYAMQHPEEDIVLPLNDSPNMADLMPPFDTMSTDWSAGNLEGWWRYQIPEEYRVNGGYLPDVVQVYLYCLCDAHNIDYAMVLAMIEVESGYEMIASADIKKVRFALATAVCEIAQKSQTEETDILREYLRMAEVVNDA